jgi:DNA-binding LytR/AlgR family response regulator
MRTFIVDDESPARRELRFLLEQIAEVTIVGEAANGTAALKGIRETNPDLLFLDIQMPGLTGLELARFLCELPVRPLIIFATAFQEHALEAFEVEAVDYLCKPFTGERVAKAVVKALRIVVASATPEMGVPKNAGAACSMIPLYRGETIIPTGIEKIMFAHAKEGEVFVHTTDGRFHARCTLSDLELKLAAVGFFRSHRSYLVNGSYVREVIPWFNGSYKLVMGDKDVTEIPVSRYNVADIKRYFDI